MENNNQISIDEVEMKIKEEQEYKKHVWELRVEEFNKHMADGKSRNNAWFLAYQMYPKDK